MEISTESDKSIYRLLDEWFGAQGFEVTASGKLISSRRWTGALHGRTVTVSCGPRAKTKYYGEDVSRRHYDGHELTIEIPTTRFTRITAVPGNAPSFGGIERFLLKRMQMQHFDPADEVYDHLKIHVHDPAWAAGYLVQPAVKAQISQVIPVDEQSISFNLQPEMLYFRMRRNLNALTPNRMEKRLRALCQLADLADAMPAPVKPARRTRFEIMLAENPVKAVLLLIGGLMGLCVLVVVTLIAVVLLGLQDLWIYGVLIAVTIWLIKRKKNG
ncbi:MAG: hypothetical protein AAF564_23610 [Bacteroidota bacterium]